MQTAATRVSQRLNLIDRIGRTLQSQYGFTDIDLYLAEFKIPPPKDATRGSKWVYTKEALRDVPLRQRRTIAHIKSRYTGESRCRGKSGSRQFEGVKKSTIACISVVRPPPSRGQALRDGRDAAYSG